MAESEEKKQLRQKYLKLRRQLEGADKRRKEAIIASKLARFLSSYHTDNQDLRVGAYLPYPDEVNILPLLLNEFQSYPHSLSLAFPLYKTSSPHIHFYTLNSPHSLRHFIEESAACEIYPDPFFWQKADPNTMLFWLVPGILFTANGHRIGYGRGIYDRFLSQWSHGITIGLAFEFQMGNFTPESFDVPLTMTMTESHTYISPHAASQNLEGYGGLL